MNYLDRLENESIYVIREAYKKTDPSEWKRFEKAHEPIIDRELWEKVQAAERAAMEKGKTQSKQKPSLFKSKLYCSDCGSSLSAQTMGHTYKGVYKRDGTSYTCHRHLMTGRAICSNHTIGEKPLIGIVISELQTHAQAIVFDETLLLEKLKKQMAADNTDDQLFLQREVRRLESLLDESVKITSSLYEDKVSGKISQDTFSKLLEKNEQERQKRQTQFDEISTQLTSVNEKILNISKWAAVIKKHMDLTELMRPDVEELIDRIDVGESDYSSGRRVQEIRIFWRFVGFIAD